MPVDKIDQLEIGSTKYDIDLPPDAEVSIKSVNASSSIKVNGTDVLTAHQSIKTLDTTATSAQSTSSSETITGSGTIKLHKISKTGNYNDLLNKPAIPTVNNGTLTIQKNGTTVQTFTANQSSNVTANITVPTKTSDLTNDSGFITGVAWEDVTGKPTFATVATSGSYNDLSNKPTSLPANGGNSDTVDNYHAEQLLVYAKYKYHDIAAFCNAAVPVYEVSADGSTGWTETTLNKDIFAAKENFSFQVTNTSQLGARFTWKAGIVWSSINYAIIGWTYQATPATVTLKFESSADSGSTWTDRGTTTGIKLNSTPALYNFSSPGGDKWFRVSIIQTSETGSKNISTIKLLTSRWGDQGLGSEYEKPYASDGDKTVRPWTNGTQLLGTSSAKWKEIHGVTIYENGTSLANKYLGKTATAADSDKLAGNDSTYYQKALPTTTTAGKVLKSTTTAGTVEWANDTNTNQTIKVGTTTFGANDVVELTAGSNVTLTPNSTNKTIEIKSSYTDTGATSIETTGTGNAVSSASYDASTRKITLTKGVTALTSHQSIKTLKTDNTTAQTASSGEALNGNGTINLHKIAKTGTYSDLIGIPENLVQDANYKHITVTSTSVSDGTNTFNKLALAGSGSATTAAKSDHNHGLLHHDLVKIIENTTTDKGWKMFTDDPDNDPPINGFFLRSIRFNSQSPAWGVGDYGAGIVFGGGDTKGVISASYGTPQIKIAGGNGDYPRWWIGLTGTSATTYNLNKLNTLGTQANYSYNSSTGTLTITTL